MKNTVRQFEWATFGVAAALVVCAVLALWLWIPPAYDTNDDATIRAVLEGTRIPGQPPTGFALLPNAILGWLLVGVRQVWPAAYAWDITVTAALVWGAAVFVTLVWGSSSSRTFRLSAAATATAAMLPLVGSVQYTISATIAGGAAVALAWSELHSEAPTRRMVLLMAAALLVLGLLLRSGGAMAGALTVSMCLLPRAMQARRRGIAAAGSLLVASLCLFAVLHLADIALYKMRPEWDAYRELNDLVTALFDWNWQSVLPSEVNIGGARRAVGWTADDWLMLEQAWGVNPDRFSVKPVRDFYESTVARLTPLDYVTAAIQRLWILDAANVSERLNEVWPALVGVLLIVSLWSRRHDSGVTLAVALSFLVFCLAVQVGFKSLPFRLLAPMIACFMCVVLATMRSEHLSKKSASLVLVVMLALCGYQARTVFAAMAANHRHSLQVDADGAALAALNPSLVVIHRDTFPEEHWWRPFHQPEVRLLTIRLSRNNQSPQFLSFLQASGLSAFPSAICDDPSVLVISEPGRLEILSMHLQESVGRTVVWKPLLTGSFRAWQCLPAPAD